MKVRWAALGGLALLAAAEAQIDRGAIVAAGIADHAAQVSAVWTQRALAMGRALDATLEGEAGSLREREEASVRRDHRPSEGVCEGVEGFRGALGARTVAAASAREAGAALVAWTVRDTVRAPGLTAAADVRTRWDTVLDRYCSPGRTAAGEAGDCAGAAERHGADLHPGAVLRQWTLADEQARQVAADWVRNVALALPERDRALRSATTAALRRGALERRARQARAGLAAGYLQERIAARLPAVSAGAWAEAIGAGSVDDARGAISAHALLGVLARGRFEGPDGFLRHQALDDPHLLRELVVSEAVALRLGFERLRDAERQGAMLAARLARAVERERQR